MLPDISADSFGFCRLVQKTDDVCSNCGGANKNIADALSALIELCSQSVAFAQGVLAQAEKQRNEGVRIRDKAVAEKAACASGERSEENGKTVDHIKRAEEADIIERHAGNAISEADNAIGRLNGLCARLRQLSGKLRTAADETFSKVSREADRLGRFSEVMRKTSYCIERMSEIGGIHAGIDVIGKIKPHAQSLPIPDKTAASFQELSSVGEEKEEIIDVIDVQTQEEFFAKADALRGARTIKFPSYALRGLGGETFLNAMSAMGYTAVKNAYGGLIDPDGMIRLKKER